MDLKEKVMDDNERTLGDAVTLGRYQRMPSVPAPNDFTVTDEAYFKDNGRQVRLRPPSPDEHPQLARSYERLGFRTFIIVHRTEAQAIPVAMIAARGALAETLPSELARFGDEQIIGLVRNPNIHWTPLEG
jgi:hypothetical protein